MAPTNLLKQRLRAGQPCFGAVHMSCDAAVAELMALAGLDFVLVDGEHGHGDERDMLHCFQAIASGGAAALVRIETDARIRINRMLDLGPAGIMVPKVETAAAAREIVAACRYAPRGTRGYAASGVRASHYGFDAKHYLDTYEDELLIVVMIESEGGVANASAIAAVEGIDLVQIGANDLSYELGVPEQLNHPDMIRAVAAVEKAVRGAGKILGGAPGPGLPAHELIGRGYRLITVGRDLSLLAGALSRRLEEVRREAGMEERI